MNKTGQSSSTLLVTTAIENNWGETEDILFLGEWCKVHDRRHIWNQRNYGTVEFHWDDREKLKRDYDYLKSLHRKLLLAFSSTLNGFHQVSYSVRYWQLLLDPWLMSYISLAFDRWESLRLAFGKTSHIETITCEDSELIHPPFSYSEYISDILTDEWNHAFFLRIVRSSYSENCSIRQHKAVGSNRIIDQERTDKTKFRKSGLRALVDSFIGIFPLKFKVVFLNSNLNLYSLVLLNLCLGQVTRLFSREFRWDVPLKQQCKDDRSKLSFEFQTDTDFEIFLRDTIILDIPTCVIENYSALREYANNMMIKTKVIVTASDHWNNPYTKFWMAEQSNKGVKLVVLEHGGSFPAYRELFDFEEDIADIRGTWFTPYHSKHVRLPPTKLISRYKKIWPLRIKRKSGKYCSVIGSECPKYVYRAHFYPMVDQCLTSLDLTLQLYQCLSEEVQRYFRVKPYPNQGWNTKKIYEETLGVNKIYHENNIDRVFNVSRLIICTYPETTFSEAMATGIPTVMIYPDKLYERHPVTYSLLKCLQENNIVFHDPEAAAVHISSIWKDPDQWWESGAVSSARAEFFRQAMDLDSNWLKKWKQFIRDVIS